MSPYVSDAQRKKFHALLAQGTISKATVDEWDKASEGKSLPERIRPQKAKPGKKRRSRVVNSKKGW